MTPDFDVTNRATWPELLLVEHIAAIFNRQPGGILRACQAHHFFPARYLTHPSRWRKADVIRALDAPKAYVPKLRRVS